MQKFELELDHSIAYYRKNGVLTGDRIRDKTYHSFGKGGKRFMGAAKRDESLFDFWMFNGRFFGIEAKQTAEKSLPHKNVHDHQIKNLQLVNSQGGIGIFIVNFKSKKRGKDGWNATYALNVVDYAWYVDTHDRSSVPMSFFEERGHRIDRVRVGFTKPKKSGTKPSPKLGWDLVSLKYMKWDCNGET